MVKLFLSVIVLLACSFLNAQEAQIIRYNNDVSVGLGVGLWGIPIPVDYDGDGKKDLLVSCPDTPYRGLYYFRNIGTAADPFFDKSVRIHEKGLNNIKYSEFDGKPYVLSPNVEWVDFIHDPYGSQTDIKYTGEVIAKGYRHSRSNMWTYVDWDDDGDRDIIVGVDNWDDYGWDNAYDSEGVWKNGPLHGYVYLLENVDGNYFNRGKIQAGSKVIDVYGAPNPCVADFDADGDLDIICGEFVDGLSWFENIGTRDNPVFAEGRQIGNCRGELRFHVCMIVPVVSDFDQDGFPDLIVGDEDGSIAWVRNTGKVKKSMPVFENICYFKQRGDELKFGALSTPWCCDWDGDGKEDIISGNSAGEITFFRNLTGGDNPSWAAPELFRTKDGVIRIMAGENGSIQGPAEKKWGYTVLSVADWDGDGNKDIIINSIFGKIQWYRNLGKKDRLLLAPAQDVTVAWSGEAPKPVWNWWDPVPGTLTTQWRTTPVAMDWNKDGLMDLVVVDHEGYLAYFERFVDADGKKNLKPGRRIFHSADAPVYSFSLWQPDAPMTDKPSDDLLRLNKRIAGKSGRRKICFVDWNGDGRLDLFVDGKNACLYQNVKEEDGHVWLEFKGNISESKLAGHSACPCPSDWDNDGKVDLVLGAEDGHFYRIVNTN